MKQSFFVMLTLLLSLNLLGCSSNTNKEDMIEIISDNEKCFGSTEFINSIKTIIASPKTRSVSDDEKIEQLVESSIVFLDKNGISYKEFIQDKNDPRIAIIAMGVLEYVKQTKIEVRTTFGGCILQSFGIRGLGKAQLTIVARELGKAVLKKAIPYVGWGLFAIEMGMCLAE